MSSKMFNKDEFVDKMKDHLDEASLRISALRLRLDLAKDESKIGLQNQIDEIECIRTDLTTKLAKVTNARELAVIDLITGCQHAWESLKSSLDIARERFKD
jgi:predicted  nucleic acid-binding Zn-ribbon protein